MIKKIEILEDGSRLFKGNVMNMPIKKDAVIEGSIELFDDDDPCIIHQSYVIKKFVEKMSDYASELDTSVIKGQDAKDILTFLDVNDVEKIEIHILK